MGVIWFLGDFLIWWCFRGLISKCFGYVWRLDNTVVSDKLTIFFKFDVYIRF